ncbi:hypothetical protein CFIMG_005964RA [Ceratocystis fimbriata CBS 114723]|uniref:MARVEL domain-containing protein n=1 Tax=Ceratocystis fimbriata CBS 114723 TaxID=1035309 RepID=A0A2C5X1J4_9PEZI|nr:hypothetical protein CFIMG_005964RA [Ceratocystis fimbriata CBS 114723]
MSTLTSTFVTARLLQFLISVSVISLSATHISDIYSAEYTPPFILTATLVVTCISIVHVAATAFLYRKSLLPLLASAGGDFAVFVALIVVVAVQGNPLSSVSCSSLSKDRASISSYAAPSDATTSSASGTESETGSKATLSYSLYTSASKSTCASLKALWALTITMCILFAISFLAQLLLWRQSRASTTQLLHSQPAMHNPKLSLSGRTGYSTDLEAGA